MKPFDEQELREWSIAQRDLDRERKATGAGQVAKEDHLSEEMAAELLGENLSSEARLDAIEAMLDSPERMGDFKLASAIDDQAQPLLEAKSRTLGWRTLLPAIGMAAALILSVTIVFMFLMAKPKNLQVRGSVEGVEALYPGHGATLSMPPEQFRWQGKTVEHPITLKLFGASGDLLWQSPPLLENQTNLPPSVGAALEPGDYWWLLTPATNVAGKTWGPFPFTIKSSP